VGRPAFGSNFLRLRGSIPRNPVTSEAMNAFGGCGFMMGRGVLRTDRPGWGGSSRGFRGDKCVSHGRSNPAERDLSRLNACVFWRVIDRHKHALGVMRQREVAHPVSEWPVNQARETLALRNSVAPRMRRNPSLKPTARCSACCCRRRRSKRHCRWRQPPGRTACRRHLRERLTSAKRAPTIMPFGVVSTISPFAAFMVRMSPLGAMVSPGG
jgi:hypothetical protein